MSTVNYLTSLTDHSEILVCVKCAGEINSKSVQYVLEQFESHRTVQINDAGRSINVKFSLDASLENSAWGCFQAHRQVWGLMYLAEVTSPMESALALEKFNKLKDLYGSGLYQSRCIIFGIDTAIRPSHSNVFQFSSHKAWKSIDYDIKQFIVAIYYKLESKRQALLQERQAKPTMIMAPFEVPEEKTAESDSKVIRRKCSGRHAKHLGDIHLLLGLIPESLQSYNTALDMLLTAGDTIWVGCALEGLCVISAMILLNDLDSDKGTSPKNDTQKVYTLNPKNLTAKQPSGLSIADIKKYCIPSFNALVDKYREAIINYSKDKEAAVVELEACIKATKIFARAKKYLEASEFIQNAVYINFNASGPERLKRYSVMGELYKAIHFKRKSFFYKRVAAMQCVSQQLSTPDWVQCKDLLLEAIMNLSSNMEDFPGGNGWPSVIQRVWRELIYALDKGGDRNQANTHLLHVFIGMFPYMNENEEKDIHASLEAFASRAGREIQPELRDFQFKLDFYKCPIIKAVLPRTDVDGSRPRKSDMSANAKSVFIYKPSYFNAKEQNDRKLQFDWCVNTPCRIDVEVYSPLAHCAIQISEFRFIIDSDEENSLDSPLFSFSVPPQVTSKVTVSITASKPGLFKIIGYRYKIFGVQAKCYFTENKDIKTREIVINVIPELPLLSCDFTGVQIDYHVNDIPEIIAFVGEILQLPFKLTNTGSSPVTSWDVLCKTKISNEQASLIYDKNFHHIELLPGSSVDLPVKVQPKIDSIELNESPCSCRLIMKYAAKLEEDEWWRTLEVDINFVFRRSIEVTNLAIESAHNFSSPACNLKVTVTSHVDEPIELTWDDYADEAFKDSISIPKSCIYTFDVSLIKLKLPEDKDVECNLQNYILQHIRTFLNISWKMKNARSKHHSGSVSYNVTLQKHDFAKLIDVPIVCSIPTNETVVSETQEAVVTLADVTHFSFEFYNASVSAQSFKVALEVYQDQMNGYVERNLDECFVSLGYTTANIELNPGEREEFPCDVLILKEGTYCVRTVYTVNVLDKYAAISNKIQCYSRPVVIKAEP